MPMACAIVTREMEKMGGKVTLRLQKNTREDLNQTASHAFVTDNGGWILEVNGLSITNPAALEAQINQIAGVLTVGIFAKEKADILLVSNTTGVDRIVL
jgi:ribose 5-phosphate isomerase A